MGEIFIGIDLGGTNIKTGCFDSDIRLICKTSTPTHADMGPELVVDKMALTIEKLLVNGGSSVQDVGAVGMGSPGPANYREGVIIKAANMPKFKNTPLPHMLSERIGKPVVFENDANVIVTVRWQNLKTNEIMVDNETVDTSVDYSTFVGQDFEYSSKVALNRAAERIVELMQSEWQE